MGSWYKPSEIAKRTAIFTAVGQVGSLFAGIMMTAMHKTMEGKAGLKGWQWVFIIGTSLPQIRHTISIPRRTLLT
jgi:ACS family pantothenate transporter-like MFS transporter